MLDDAFAQLANVHRRRVLLALLDHNPQTVEELSVPADSHAAGVSPEQLQMNLYHVHLPKLEAAGFITWNKDNQQVVKGPNFSDIKPLLEVLTENANELPEELY